MSKKKFIQLVERDSLDELRAYFETLSAEKPLDLEDELLMLEHFCPEVVKAFTNRFRFSEKAEVRFINVAPQDIRRPYINYRGLWPSTQKYVIDNNLVDVARDFSEMRSFDDVDYLLEHGSPIMIDNFLRDHSISDAQLLTLAHHPSKLLFRSYVSRGKYGRFISESVIEAIVNEQLESAFNAIVWQFGRNFKKRAKTMSYEEMQSKHLDNIMLPAKFQVQVLKDCNRWMVEPLLKTTPLAVEAQDTLFAMNYDAEWLKIHVVNMYCVGSYRFKPQYEEKLFKALAKKNLDDCLLEFRHRDDVMFVTYATPATVIKYLKERWPTDDGQVAALSLGNGEIARSLISRFTPEHGMCWQAEVKLVEIYSVDIINLYTVFHSMCAEALSLLRQKSEAGINFYYQHHSF